MKARTTHRWPDNVAYERYNLLAPKRLPSSAFVRIQLLLLYYFVSLGVTKVIVVWLSRHKIQNSIVILSKRVLCIDVSTVSSTNFHPIRINASFFSMFHYIHHFLFFAWSNPGNYSRGKKSTNLLATVRDEFVLENCTVAVTSSNIYSAFRKYTVLVHILQNFLAEKKKVIIFFCSNWKMLSQTMLGIETQSSEWN